MHAAFTGQGLESLGAFVQEPSAFSSGEASSPNKLTACGRDASVRPSSRRHALLVLLGAALVLTFGQGIVGHMFHSTKNVDWQTPVGSESLAAAERAKSIFPKRMNGALVMAVEAEDETLSVLSDAVAVFSRNVSDSIQRDKRVRSYAPIVVGYYLDVMGFKPPRHVMEKEFVSKDKKMTVILIQPTKMEGRWSEANQFLQEFCSAPPPGYTLHITGMPAVLSGDGCSSGVHAKVNTRDMNFEALFKAEVCSMPFALLIIAYIIKYPRLLILPLLIVAIAFVVAAAIVGPWMELVPIPKDVPAAMGSVTLALCLDYCLFMLSRFSDQHMEGWPLQQNVDKIKRYTARTIAVSGILVAIAFLGSILLPEKNIQGTGLCLGFATLACVGVSVTVIPAILLLSGTFLTGFANKPIGANGVELHGYIDNDPVTADFGDPARRRRDNGLWLHVMRVVDKWPLGALLVVVLLMGPLLTHLPQLNITGDRFAMLPMEMPAITALRRVQQDFPVGILDPYSIVISAPRQKSGDAALEGELRDGLASVESHDIKAAAAKMGLEADETDAIVAAVKGEQGLVGGMRQVKVDPHVVASVEASSAAALEMAHGASDADAMRAAVRAAKATGYDATVVRDAVMAASGAILSKDRAVAAETEEAVTDEALKLGMVEAEAASLAASVTRHARGSGAAAVDGNVEAASEGGAVKLSEAAALAGAAAARRKSQGDSDVGILKDALHAVEGSDITGEQVQDIVHAIASIGQQGFREAHAGVAEVPAVAGAASRETAHSEQEADAHKEEAAHEVTEMPEHRRVPGFISALAKAITKRHTRAAVATAASEATATGHDVAKETHAAVENAKNWETAVHKQWPVMLDVVDAVEQMSSTRHGALLLPSGYKAMLELCNVLTKLGGVSSMVGPSWAYRDPVDWATAVALNANHTVRQVYWPILQSHVSGNHALLEVHTVFPSIGAGGADFVLSVREALLAWEARNPGYRAEISGGAAEAADTRSHLLESMWSYLVISVSLITVVVYYSFNSLMVPLRLALALVFTLAATFGAGAVIYQTPLLHSIFPQLANFYGISFEVVPLVTGVAIALGLDYDIFLVSRIVEFRLQRFTDRASIFRGVLKTGEVISGAGLIMALAFTGLCFSDKLLFQQFGVLLIISVLFDTFVVRTVLVPALMLVAQSWNWWPRDMPPAIHDILEGDVQSSGGLSSPMLAGTALGDVGVSSMRGDRKASSGTEDWYGMSSGAIA